MAAVGGREDEGIKKSMIHESAKASWGNNAMPKADAQLPQRVLIGCTRAPTVRAAVAACRPRARRQRRLGGLAGLAGGEKRGRKGSPRPARSSRKPQAHGRG